LDLESVMQYTSIPLQAVTRYGYSGAILGALTPTFPRHARQGEACLSPAPLAPRRHTPPCPSPMRLRQFSQKRFALSYSDCMPRRSIKPSWSTRLTLRDLTNPPPKGVRAMLIRRTKLKYPELSELQIARYIGCCPSNVHRVLKAFFRELYT
jgi:hypothetical protein